MPYGFANVAPLESCLFELVNIEMMVGCFMRARASKDILTGLAQHSVVLLVSAKAICSQAAMKDVLVREM